MVHAWGAAREGGGGGEGCLRLNCDPHRVENQALRTGIIPLHMSNATAATSQITEDLVEDWRSINTRRVLFFVQKHLISYTVKYHWIYV